MRKKMTIGVAVAALLLAGCGTQPTAPAPETTASEPSQTTSAEQQSKRTAPVKSLEIADECSIVTEQQWRALGAEHAPRSRTSNGTPGCEYSRGEAGYKGWIVFVAADQEQTLQEFVKRNERRLVARPVIEGYPAAMVAGTGQDCILVLDVSDEGSLYSQSYIRERTQNPPDPCKLAKKFAKAALKNLENAKGA